jgi:hypothetical protein
MINFSIRHLIDLYQHEFMATILHDHWELIRERIKARIEANGIAEINSVISSIVEGGGFQWPSGAIISMEEIQIIAVGLTASGEYDNKIDTKDQAFVFKSVSYELQKSIIATNDSIKNLNDVIIPRFNRRQNNLTIITMVIAGISLLAIAISAYYSSKAITSTELQETNRQLQNNAKILASMLQPQKGIDSSLRKLAKDSSFRKH